MTIREQLKKIKFIMKGVATYFPQNIARFFPAHQIQFSGRGVRPYPGAREVARSCYSSWMRTIVTARELGVTSQVFENTKCVGEIGPGDTLGVGFAMLLSGADHYFAFDVVPTVSNFENKIILEELITLFKERTPIPDDKEYPKAYPRLSSYQFPDDIFTEEILERVLSDTRLDAIRKALDNFLSGKRDANSDEISIDYYAPWYGAEALSQLQGRLDLVVSFAAMEHVDDIGKMYAALALIIKRGGHMIHIIDFKSHGTAGMWNGYWTYSLGLWKVVRGQCRYLINREPYSAHLKEMSKNFIVIGSHENTLPNMLSRTDLAKGFLHITDDDLVTAGAFVVAQRS